jgi:flagellar hook-associated protein 3 FlgL
MRVTDRQIFEGANQRLGTARSRMEAATREASTGLKVVHAGDDAAAAGQIVARRLDATRQAALKGTVDAANDELATTDGALDAIGNALTRARELAVQIANPVYSAGQRQSAAQEIDGLFKTVVAQLNTRVGQRYVFGGHQDDAPPFTAAGVYQGDTGVRQVEIAPGVQHAVSVRADGMAAGANGGTDVLATLSALSAAMASNNVANVRNSLDGLDAGIQQVASARVQVGAAMVVLDAAGVASRAGKDDALTALSRLTEADTFESASKLALSQRGLEAAIEASAKSFQLSILGKL